MKGIFSYCTICRLYFFIFSDDFFFLLYLFSRELSFTETKTIRVFCGTWNVNAKLEENIELWLTPENSLAADIYAIGIQEMVDLNAVNVAFDGSKTIQRSQTWRNKFLESLSKLGNYYFISEKSLVGVYLVIFVSENLAAYVKDIRTASTSVGLLGLMGNKGGVCIRMSVYDSPICFVCSHLTAHRENVTGMTIISISFHSPIALVDVSFAVPMYHFAICCIYLTYV
jgi:phosphatidylinositol-bisphosphatase